MEVATLPEQETEPEAPVEAEAEATRTSAHLFQYSTFIDVGGDAPSCEHKRDGKCKDADHFHAWLVMPNSIQHADIQEKARAAKARRQLAMRDPASDSYAMVEADLDALMEGDREVVLDSLAAQAANKRLNEIVLLVRAMDEFEDYGQHREEYQRLSKMSEEERPEEEFETAKGIVDRFATEVTERLEDAQGEERKTLEGLGNDVVRDMLRRARVEQESEEISRRTYYKWMAFVGTRKVGNHQLRVFDSLGEFSSAPPEAVEQIDEAMEQLELRLLRGDAQGN